MQTIVRLLADLLFSVAGCILVLSATHFCRRDRKARVFITDSRSWEMSGYSGGGPGAGAAVSHGGARPQTAEIIKTLGERCPTWWPTTFKRKPTI